jgi:hypothetical protein
MALQWLDFPVRADAVAYRDAVDAALGYPRPDGISRHYLDIQPEYSTGDWVLPYDDTIAAAGVAIPGTCTVVADPSTLRFMPNDIGQLLIQHGLTAKQLRQSVAGITAAIAAKGGTLDEPIA